MTNSNDALRASLGDKPAVEKMSATLDAIHEKAAPIYPASPVAGWDLLDRLSDEADLCRNDGADDIAGLLDEAIVALKAAALNQPAVPVEVVEPGKGTAFGPRRAVNCILAKLIGPYEPDLVKRIEIGNAACTEIIAVLAPPEPAASTVAQGEAVRIIDQCLEENTDLIEAWYDGGGWKNMRALAQRISAATHHKGSSDGQ